MAASVSSRVLAFAVLFAVGGVVTPARAVDGTWIGGGAPVLNEWNQGNNWNSVPANTIPDNTAIFTTVPPAVVTALTISGPPAFTFINTIQFDAGAPAYSFSIVNTSFFIGSNGSGIVNNSSNAPSFTTNNLASSLFFQNASTASNAVITNNGILVFNDTSTAGTAFINNTNILNFNNGSTAGNATINNNVGGFINFSDTEPASGICTGR
jgi:hypothetical protein